MTYDAVIIGAGISGLAAAHQCKKFGLDVIVLEARDKPGGCINSWCQGEVCVERGAHGIFNSYQNFLEMYQDLPAKPSIISKAPLPFLVWKDGALEKVTKYLRFGQLLGNVWRVATLKKQHMTVSEYYGQLVGKDNYHTIIKPALDAVICQDCATMPASFLFKKRKKNRQYPKKMSFRGGLFAAMDAMSLAFDVVYNTKVTMVRKKKGGEFTIHGKEEAWKARNIIFATPVKTTKRLSAGILDPRLFHGISTARFFSASVLVAREQVAHLPACAGWIGLDAPFYSMVSSDPVTPDGGYRGFTFHFRPAVLTEAKMREIIAEALAIAQDSLETLVVTEQSLPKLEPEFRGVACQEDSVGICGNYIAGMSIEDCVIQAYTEVKRLWSEKH
jgi:protoporphyrinogen/coproporphyrinogen III oxidase